MAIAIIQPVGLMWIRSLCKRLYPFQEWDIWELNKQIKKKGINFDNFFILRIIYYSAESLNDSVLDLLVVGV